MPRPGDWIRITTDKFAWHPATGKGTRHIVTEASYTNGIELATNSISWIEWPSECEYVRRASDQAFIRALEKDGQ